MEDKIIISNKYILPEIYEKMGLEDAVVFSDEVLKFIIEEYTLESGVRKLKQLLFEIISEINLDILKNPMDEHNIPVHVTVESVKTKYFKSKRIVNVQLIHTESQVGSINCLYATEAGSSGILAATAKFFPSDKFLELKLTGLLDQMMQESFQISFTLAYNLTNEERKKEIFKLYNNENKYGIHLHMGDGSINKSGTSAGIAITLLMYSLLNNKKINNTFAVTGEASNLNGHVGEIGALGYKFKGGIKAGVKNFIFPTDNIKDYNEFMEKHENTDLVKGIKFYPISHIDEAIKLIMVD
jgi:ATP-dependent Lon protease